MTKQRWASNMAYTMRDYEYINRVCGLHPVTWSSVLITSPDQEGLRKVQRRLDRLEHNERELARFLAQNDISTTRLELASLMISQTRRYIGALNDTIDEIQRFIISKQEREEGKNNA